MKHSGSDIAGLLHANGHQAHTAKPAPLLLDRITLGRRRTLVSEALIFQLPVEILGQITKHIDRRDLCNLALVNSDCRQLARSRQFVSLRLDYGSRTFDVLGHMNSHAHGHSISACVRRLEICTAPTALAQRHGLADYYMLDNQTVSERINQAATGYYKYLSGLESVLEQGILPNLGTFSWQDHATLPLSLLNRLAGSSVRRLSLRNFTFRDDYRLEMPPHVPRETWSLKVLELDGHWDLTEPEERRRSLSLLHRSLFKLCAASLEVLVLGHTDPSKPKACSLRDPLTGHVPELRNLRTFVTTDRVKFANSSYFDAIFGPHSRLIEAEVDLEQQSTRSFFETPQNIPSLKTLSIVSAFSDSTAVATSAFTAANPQLESIDFKTPLPQAVMDQVLQVMCDSCPNLRTLSLHSREDDLSLTTLYQLSRLTALERLSLTVIPQSASTSWMPSHTRLLPYLRTLQSLKQIVFTNDAYASGFTSHSDPTDYYEHHRVHPQNDAEWQIRDRVQHTQLYDLFDIRDIDEDEELDLQTARQNMLFEVLHERRMREHVGLYAEALPALRYVWLGRIRWEVDGLGSVRRVSVGHDEVVDVESSRVYGVRKKDWF